MKAKFKKLLPYILIIVAVILLGIVISVVLQFKFKGEVINIEEPEVPVEEKSYDLVNYSSMDKEELINLLDSKREEIVNYLNPIKYYNLIDVVPSSSEEDNNKFMVLTDDFINNLKLYVSSSLLDKLIYNFEIVKEDENTVYYKVSKEEFNPLFNESALNIFNYTDVIIYPLYANDDKIDSIIKFKYCDKEDTDLCRRNDDYQFNLINGGNDWLISDIGYSFNE